MARSLRSLGFVQVSQDPGLSQLKDARGSPSLTTRGARAQVRAGQGRGSGAYAWCFTLNNPSEEEVQRLKDAVAARPFTKYIVANEKGAEGTPHLQGWLRFQVRVPEAWPHW